jgi:uncharacterized protein
MRIVALEEHVALSSFNGEIAARGGRLPGASKRGDLEDVYGARLASMDEAGISVQVLSVPGSGAVITPSSDAPEFARRYNLALAEVVRVRPDRFAAFATLPMNEPAFAAGELEFAVRECGLVGALTSGLSDGKFLDHPSYEPLLACAEALDVPIYVHPGLPPAAVRAAYYDGFSAEVSRELATGAWGWHAETALHILRMVVGGVFERHPNLRVIVGHMGEGLPAMMARFDDFLTPEITGLARTVSRTILDHVSITTSGIFTVPPFLAALLTFGPERILFSVDYPFSNNLVARSFLDALPIDFDCKEKIAFGNADRLLRLKRH